MLHTSNAQETQGSTDGNAQGNAQSKARGRVPEAFVRDADIDEATLVLTAYRSTFSKSYVLREGELLTNPPVKPGSGLGQRAIRKTISRMRALGIIKRRQPKPTGRNSYQPVEETFMLEAPARGFLEVYRRWFDACLSLKAMAAWLYVMVGTGKGPVVWAREIRDRFGWDPKTCGKVVGELDKAGRLSTSSARGDGGRYRGLGYQAEKWEKPHSEKPHNQKLHNILKTSPTEDLPTNPSGKGSESQEGYYASTCVEAPTSSETHGQEQSIEEPAPAEIHYRAATDRTMLGWVGEHALTGAVFDGGPYEEHLEAVGALADDAELRRRLVAAGCGRIGRRLLAPEGLHSVRWLTAALVRDGDDIHEPVSPAKALAVLLEAVEARIGRRKGQWLNSWELIGRRLAGRQYESGDAAEQVFVGTSPLLSILIGADDAKALKAGLKSDAAGLAAFVQEQAAKHGASVDHVGEVMRSTLATRGLFGDLLRGAIKSWRYFEGPIADEMRRVELSETSIRPGDVLGEHMRRPKGA
jgi:hypothetical protein